MEISNFLKRMVSITLFNKGQASKIFKRVNKEGAQVVIKNNSAIAIIVPPKEYELLQTLSQICYNEINQKGFIEPTEEIQEILKEIRNINEAFCLDV